MAYRRIHVLISSYTQYHTDIAEERRDDDTLDDDQLQDAPGLGANGLTDTKLMGTLLHGDEHDVRNAHNAREQCEEADDPECRTNDGDTLFHLQTHRIAIENPEGTLVFRMYLMVGIQATTIFLFEIFVGLLCRQSVKGILQASYLVGIGSVDAFDGSIAGVSLSLTLLAILINTNDLKSEVAYFHILAQQRGIVSRLQFLGLLIAQHQHLTLLTHIEFVNKSSIEHIVLVDLRMYWIDTRYRGTDILVAVADGGTGLIACTHLVDMVLEV